MNKNTLKLVLTTICGNTIEWYDFTLFSLFAPILAKNFFPHENPLTALMATFGVFASGFLMRPLGGALFGYIGDRYGRKKALTISIVLVTLPTALVGVLPDYQHLGFIAPILLTVLRLFQGLAVSGELTGGATFLFESAPLNKKAWYGSFITSSTYFALILGTVISYLLTLIFNQNQIAEFAWRFPFLLSLIFGIISLLLRLNCEESPMFIKARQTHNLLKAPIKKVFSKFLPQMILMALLTSSLAVAVYLLVGYFPSFFITSLKISFKNATLISFIGAILLTLLIPIMGILTDKINRKWVLGSGTLGFLFFSVLIFKIASHASFSSALLTECLMVLLIAPITASLMTILSEILPTNVRCTGISISYNCGMALFGGTTPLIATYLTKTFNSILAPAYYLMICSVITLIALITISTKSYYHGKNLPT